MVVDQERRLGEIKLQDGLVGKTEACPELATAHGASELAARMMFCGFDVSVNDIILVDDQVARVAGCARVDQNLRLLVRLADRLANVTDTASQWTLQEHLRILDPAAVRLRHVAGWTAEAANRFLVLR